MRIIYRLLIATLLVSLLSACGGSSSTTTSSAASQTVSTSDDVNLSWTVPATRTDGSYLPLNELAGYRVYMGTSSSSLSPLVDLNDDTITSYTVTNLPAGSYYFAVSAYDTDGTESGYSQILIVQLT